eukprot:9165684-Alexandrium_andersonii.AAC.1
MQADEPHTWRVQVPRNAHMVHTAQDQGFSPFVQHRSGAIAFALAHAPDGAVKKFREVLAE